VEIEIIRHLERLACLPCLPYPGQAERAYLISHVAVCHNVPVALVTHSVVRIEFSAQGLCARSPVDNLHLPALPCRSALITVSHTPGSMVVLKGGNTVNLSCIPAFLTETVSGRERSIFQMVWLWDGKECSGQVKMDTCV